MPAQAVPWLPVGLPSGMSDDAFEGGAFRSRGHGRPAHLIQGVLEPGHKHR